VTLAAFMARYPAANLWEDSTKLVLTGSRDTFDRLIAAELDLNDLTDFGWTDRNRREITDGVLTLVLHG
jgi:hypothetical protein